MTTSRLWYLVFYGKFTQWFNMPNVIPGNPIDTACVYSN